MARRLFYADECSAGRAYVRGATAEHLRRVLRAERGQHYEISDGERRWLGRIEAFGRESVEFALVEELPAGAAPARVHLLASLFKFDHFEWMLEKATELGVERITPVASIRSERGLEAAAAKRLSRWERIAREAGQQSRRVRPPEIGGVLRFDQALAAAADQRRLLDEDPGGASIFASLAGMEGTVAVLCGPPIMTNIRSTCFRNSLRIVCERGSSRK